MRNPLPNPPDGTVKSTRPRGTRFDLSLSPAHLRFAREDARRLGCKSVAAWFNALIVARIREVNGRAGVFSPAGGGK